MARLASAAQRQNFSLLRCAAPYFASSARLLMPPDTELHKAARDGDLGQIEDLLREGFEVDASRAIVR